MKPRLDAVGIVSDDVPRSLAFYRLLGIDVDDPAEGQPHVEATLPSGLRLLWDTPEIIRSFEPDWQPPSGGQRLGLAFAVDAAADVDALYAELEAAGHPGEIAPCDAPWGPRYAVARDPDGNTVDLFAPSAG
jgi:catechol 2,3-dioxygenase-like lactoylglutathione lyase family enzyme